MITIFNSGNWNQAAVEAAEPGSYTTHLKADFGKPSEEIKQSNGSWAPISEAESEYGSAFALPDVAGSQTVTLDAANGRNFCLDRNQLGPVTFAINGFVEGDLVRLRVKNKNASPNSFAFPNTAFVGPTQADLVTYSHLTNEETEYRFSVDETGKLVATFDARAATSGGTIPEVLADGTPTGNNVVSPPHLGRLAVKFRHLTHKEVL